MAIMAMIASAKITAGTTKPLRSATTRLSIHARTFTAHLVAKDPLSSP